MARSTTWSSSGGFAPERSKSSGDAQGTGTTITFFPDPQIFSTVEIQYEIVEKRLRETAYLMGTRGLRLELCDERNGKNEVFEYPEGLQTFVEHVNKNKTALHSDTIHFSKEVESSVDPGTEYEVELAFQYTDGYQETVYTFVNNINTHGGGTHLTGLKSALARVLGSYARAEKLVKDADGMPLGGRFP